MNNTEKISGRIVDVVKRQIINGHLLISNGKIEKIIADEQVPDQYIIPGFIDAHIHIESSMLLPAEFARQAVAHGTVACVCDPHEIANVCGVEGVDFMIQNGLTRPFKFFFGAPSCVPATNMDTAGAVLDAVAVRKLLERDDIYFLSEMMNYTGVIEGDEEVMRKLASAVELHKRIDGHSPELRGDDLKKYVAGGITTDHECMTVAEAEDKIALGMMIQIREGSAAKNFDDLLPLMLKHADRIMFCSDDKHPDDLIKNGHINALARRAVAAGFDAVDVLRVCSYNPVNHYRIAVGLLQEGDDADFVVVNNLIDFDIISTYVKGENVAENGKSLLQYQKPESLINNFKATKISTSQIAVEPKGEHLKVILVDDGQLFTHVGTVKPLIKNNNVVSDVENDVLKMVVYNRYQPSQPSVAFIKNIGLKRGALASTVSHDSHNIVAVGVSDEDIVRVINLLIDCKGGIVAADNERVELLPLPVGGLMSPEDGETVAHIYEKTDAFAKELGSTLKAPFMTVAFMSLLVIPKLKLSDKGLFDGRSYEFTPLMT